MLLLLHSFQFKPWPKLINSKWKWSNLASIWRTPCKSTCWEQAVMYLPLASQSKGLTTSKGPLGEFYRTSPTTLQQTGRQKSISAQPRDRSSFEHTGLKEPVKKHSAIYCFCNQHSKFYCKLSSIVLPLMFHFPFLHLWMTRLFLSPLRKTITTVKLERDKMNTHSRKPRLGLQLHRCSGWDLCYPPSWFSNFAVHLSYLLYLLKKVDNSSDRSFW